MDFYGVGIYIVIIIVAVLFVAFIIFLIARSMLRGTSAPSQEREAEELTSPLSTEPELGQPVSPVQPEPEPSQPAFLEREAGPTNTIPQETELTTSPSLEEVDMPESFDGEDEKSGQGGDVLNLFRVEEVEDTGLSELAGSLEEVDIHSLTRMTEEVSLQVKGE